MSFRTQDDQAEFMDEVMPSLQGGMFDSVEQLVADDPPLPQLTHLAVANRSMGQDQLRQLLVEIVQRDVMGDLEYRTNWIATTIKSGPLLGLFGTVLGMMAAFGRIGTGEKVEPVADRRGNQHRAHLHGYGAWHGDSVQLLAGELDDADSRCSGRAGRRPDSRVQIPQDPANG